MCSRGEFELADTSESIARNLIALEDAYGLYIIGGAPIVDEAVRQILSFASMATRCDLRLFASRAPLSQRSTGSGAIQATDRTNYPRPLVLGRSKILAALVLAMRDEVPPGPGCGPR